MSPLYFIIQVVSTFVNAHIPLIKRKKLELFLGKLLTNKNTYGIISPLRKATSIFGGIAQLGERLNGIQEVRGSTPLISTKSKRDGSAVPFALMEKKRTRASVQDAIERINVMLM